MVDLGGPNTTAQTSQEEVTVIPLAQTSPFQISFLRSITVTRNQLCAIICDDIRSAAMQRLEADVVRCLLP